MTEFTALFALTSLDGRYQSRTKKLTEYFSEFDLVKYRVRAEIEYLLAFTAETKVINISVKLAKSLRSIYTSFSEEDAEKAKVHEAKCHHDVKAIEYFLQDKFRELGCENFIPYIHIGLTSEDTNSIAYGLALKESRDNILLPTLWEVIEKLAEFIKQHLELPMLARTHGQAAVPTTLGKEYAVFLSRLLPEVDSLAEQPIAAKVSGAVGTFAALELTYSKVDWSEFAEKFLVSLDLKSDPLSTQIVSPESYIRLFQNFERINNILLDCARDSWQYISDGWLVQTLKAGEVGSSTMPQKVNPIDFENAEGNFGLANALFYHFSAKLPVSRLQRDLSDSTVKRSIGSAFGYSLLGYQSVIRGLGKVAPDEVALKKALDYHPEIIAEGLQTLLRAEGHEDAYEALKNATRGKKTSSVVELQELVTKLTNNPSTKEKIAKLSQNSYTGLASELTKQTLKLVNNYKKRREHAK
ncbi:MAG: adenylosuccinate lyase [Candidatus Pacebacteria bacterium CG_4_10_14_0_8_um_filter_42_14]|nr:MAG: adenylosuccinate lyase [Candidatus Pacebacteria bacterium CG_4_10_14_0_8_um_filter_42_14]